MNITVDVEPQFVIQALRQKLFDLETQYLRQSQALKIPDVPEMEFVASSGEKWGYLTLDAITTSSSEAGSSQYWVDLEDNIILGQEISYIKELIEHLRGAASVVVNIKGWIPT